MLRLFGVVPPRTGIPVLDETRTSQGYDNFNALSYLDIHSQYARNSREVLLHKPITYVRAQLSAWFSYFLPASDLPYYFPHQTERFRGWERTFSQVFLGQIYRSSQRTELIPLREQHRYLEIVAHTGIVLMVILPLLMLWGLAQFLLARLRRTWATPQQVVLGFMLFTIIFPAMIGNSLSCCETNCYRFPLEPYFVVLGGLAVTRRPVSEADTP